jgi:hypothetical protein
MTLFKHETSITLPFISLSAKEPHPHLSKPNPRTTLRKMYRWMTYKLEPFQMPSDNLTVTVSHICFH